MNNSLYQLRQHLRATSTRPFRARGSIVQRCQQCQMADFACFCPWRIRATSKVEFILLLHRNEVFKPTNSGRLVADCFPDNTHVFLWSRTEPEAELLALLADSSYSTKVLFPETTLPAPEATLPAPEATLPESEIAAIDNEDGAGKPLRMVLLDGTWKQAAKMARQSEWLQTFPRISLCEADVAQVLTQASSDKAFIRKAAHDHQLSTAQAAACLLYALGEERNGSRLADYFAVFNQHCIATRRNLPPAISPAHQRLNNHQTQVAR